MKRFKEEIKHRLEGREKGFTLIEVIVVLVIIAILMAIAVPNVLGYINRAKETEAEAQARNLYIASTAQLAIVLGKVEGGSTGGDLETALYLNEPANKRDIAQMAQIEEDNFEIYQGILTYPHPANGDVSEGYYMVYVSHGVIAYVVYQYDQDTYAIYNGVTGNIYLGSDAVLYDFNF